MVCSACLPWDLFPLSSLLVVPLVTVALVPGAGGDGAEARLQSSGPLTRTWSFLCSGLQQKFLLLSQCRSVQLMPQGVSACRSPV